MSVKAASASNVLPPGALLQEYRIEKMLGAGSFGIIYCGEDTHLLHRVAIKEYFPDDLALRDGERLKLKFAADEELYRFGLEAFISEARLLARLRHPNIIRVARYFTANDTAYFVMDYEEGTTLAEMLKSGWIPDEPFLRQLLNGILDGLQCVHDNSYLHRDIKPGNIYLREKKTPVLIDFGAAKSEFIAASVQGFCAITPGYAAPELYEGNGVQGPWTDLYALGATLYRCLFGVPPHEAPVRLYASQNSFPEPRPAAVISGKDRYSTTLLKTIDWLLALDPRERPQNARQVRQMLRSEFEAKQSETVAQTFSYQPRKHVRHHRILFVNTTIDGHSKGRIEPFALLTPKAKNMEQTTGQYEVRHVTVDIEENETLDLYEAARFDSMRSFLEADDKPHGIVALIDGGAPSPKGDLSRLVEVLRASDADGLALAIGIIRQDKEEGPPIDMDIYTQFLQNELRWSATMPPVFSIAPRRRNDLLLLLESLLISIAPAIDHEQHSTS